jgi:hypothetical protein
MTVGISYLIVINKLIFLRLSILAAVGLGSWERTFSSSEKIRVEDICGLACGSGFPPNRTKNLFC